MSKDDSTKRFSDRVEAYIKFRPDYPDKSIDWILAESRVDKSSCIADVGSGTGIFTRQLLQQGMKVIAIEPNEPMRLAAEKALSHELGFTSAHGTAEALPLETASADLITCAQAFHWFDLNRAKQEFARVLKSTGLVALIWNDRRTKGNAFLDAYERFLLTHGTDYAAVNHKQIGAIAFDRFFTGPWVEQSFDNAQTLDAQGLQGRVISSSYMPAPGTGGHAAMLMDLDALFQEHAIYGRVKIEYDTTVFIGAVHI